MGERFLVRMFNSLFERFLVRMLNALFKRFLVRILEKEDNMEGVEVTFKYATSQRKP